MVKNGMTTFHRPVDGCNKICLASTVTNEVIAIIYSDENVYACSIISDSSSYRGVSHPCNTY